MSGGLHEARQRRETETDVRDSDTLFLVRWSWLDLGDDADQQPRPSHAPDRLRSHNLTTARSQATNFPALFHFASSGADLLYVNNAEDPFSQRGGYATRFFEPPIERRGTLYRDFWGLVSQAAGARSQGVTLCYFRLHGECGATSSYRNERVE